MPTLHLVRQDECIHGGVHPKWHYREGLIAICNMSKPHLENSIKMMQRTLAIAYPHRAYSSQTTMGQRSPLQTQEIISAEDTLSMLLNEQKRRQGF